jgi:hypothetical protein
MNPQQQKEIFELRNDILSRELERNDWVELGYSIGCYDIISEHSRLLRSLSWGDDDYPANILEVLGSIAKRNFGNLAVIRNYLDSKFEPPVVSDFISTAHTEVPKRNITFSPQVFHVPDKKQNDKLVSMMFPFAHIKSFLAVKSAVEDLQLECIKADDIWMNTTFIQDIFELIFTSRVIVADFTGKNPNVFYEVGIAHTLGKTVIPITQSIDDVPSDLRHHRVLLYHPNEQGYRELAAEIKKRLQTLIPNFYSF